MGRKVKKEMNGSKNNQNSKSIIYMYENFKEPIKNTIMATVVHTQVTQAGAGGMKRK